MSEEKPAEDVGKSLMDENKRLRESVLYLQAELANMRRLLEKEAEKARQLTQERILSRLLRVYEDLKKGVDSLQSSDNPFTVAEGFSLILREVESLLQSEGVERMDVVGKPFNPFEHEAVSFIEGGGGEDTVVEEVEPGYRLGEKILRVPKVKVARRKGEQ
ncbi:MAG: nucleotide exchange factor GrpE [Nitrososphaerota archaeon]